MADETQEETQAEATEPAAPAETATSEETEAASQATPATTDAPAAETEMVFCAVSKQQVPLAETVELERKKGEKLRIHTRYKKF